MSDSVGRSAPATIIRVTAVLLTLVFAYLWVSRVDENSTAFGDATEAAWLALGVFASLFFGGLIFNLLWIVPAAIFREQEESIRKMEGDLTPVIALTAHNGGLADSLPSGKSTVNSGGFVMTNTDRTNPTISGLVHNKTRVDLDGIGASIVELRGDNGRELVDAIELEWASGHSGPYTSIPAGGRRRLLFSGFRMSGPAISPPIT